MSHSETPQSLADQLDTVQLDQDGKTPLSKNALKKLEKEREKAKKKVQIHWNNRVWPN